MENVNRLMNIKSSSTDYPKKFCNPNEAEDNKVFDVTQCDFVNDKTFALGFLPCQERIRNYYA